MPLAPGSAPDLAPPATSGAPLHWVIPFAASLSEPCQHALTRLKDPSALPRLSQLLDRLHPEARLEGDEYALAMPHERLLAHELGWQEPGGLQPWGAWWAAQDGLTLPADRCWALLSPGHWLMGRDHLTLLDPAGLGLGDDESRALLDALRPFFEEDGWHWARVVFGNEGELETAEAPSKELAGAFACCAALFGRSGGKSCVT